MLDQFYMPDANSGNTALKQYCKLENISPADLKIAAAPRAAIRTTVRIRLERLACHGLSHIDRGLHLLSERLMADLENKGRAEGYQS